MGPLAKLYGLLADVLQCSILPVIHDCSTTMFAVFVNFVATNRLSLGRRDHETSSHFQSAPHAGCVSLEQSQLFKFIACVGVVGVLSHRARSCRNDRQGRRFTSGMTRRTARTALGLARFSRCSSVKAARCLLCQVAPTIAAGSRIESKFARTFTHTDRLERDQQQVALVR